MKNSREPSIELGFDVLLEVLNILRLTPLFSLMGSEHESDIGYEFEPWKGRGLEKAHALRAQRLQHRIIKLVSEQR
jgi:hypothetical protein